MQYRPDSPGDFNELSLTVYLTDGFHDETVRLKESDVMNRLMDIKSEVENSGRRKGCSETLRINLTLQFFYGKNAGISLS
jgi:hypothetical protein